MYYRNGSKYKIFAATVHYKVLKILKLFSLYGTFEFYCNTSHPHLIAFRSSWKNINEAFVNDKRQVNIRLPR